jgi:hypothetical protein
LRGDFAIRAGDVIREIGTSEDVVIVKGNVSKDFEWAVTDTNMRETV